MKRVLVAIFLCLYCFTLFGCAAKANEKGTSLSSGIHPESASESVPPPIASEDTLFMVKKPDKNTDIASCEEGLYFFVENPRGGNNILYLNYQSKQINFLTANQNAKHYGSEDSSWFSEKESYGGLFPFIVNNKLYVLKMATTSFPETIGEQGDAALGCIYAMNRDGTERRTLVTFGDKEEAAHDFGMASDGEYLFLVKTIYDNGVRKQTLTKIHLETGNAQDIVTLQSGNNFIMGVFENSLLIQTFSTPDIPVGENGFDAAQAQFEAQSFILYMLDLRTFELDVLKQWVQDEIILGEIFEDGFIYIDLESNSVCKLNLGNNQNETLSLIPFAIEKYKTFFDGIYDGRFLFKTLPPNAPLYYRSAYNICSGEFHEMTIKISADDNDGTFDNNPIAESSEYFVLFDPVPDTFSLSFQLIKKQDYWNNRPAFINIGLPEVE